MSAYAAKTDVTVGASRAEIEELVTRFGARSFLSGSDGRRAMIAFEARGRRVMLRLDEPDPADPAFGKTPAGRARDADGRRAAYEQERRRRWRALCLALKAKLVAVEEGIETFEAAFMAHIVMPDGLTIGDHVAPRIADAYATGSMPPLLPGPDR